MTINLRVPSRPRGGAKRIRGLIVDQDIEARHLVGQLLGAAGIHARQAEDGETALKAWNLGNPFSFILIDPRITDIDGLAICSYIRLNSQVPIIVYSNIKEENYVVSAFDAGADDFLPKPVLAVELLAHINALVSRVGRLGDIRSRATHVTEEIVIEPQKGRVTKGQKNIRLSSLQFKVLEYLMNNVGRVISVEELLTNVWGYENPHGGQNLVQVTIHRIRERIEDDPTRPDFLFTVRNMGYRFG